MADQPPNGLNARDWDSLLLTALNDPYAHAAVSLMHQGRGVGSALTECLLACIRDRHALHGASLYVLVAGE